MQSKQHETRDKIIYKYSQNNLCSYSMIAKDLKVPLTTVKRVIKRFLIIGNVNRKPGSGFQKKPLNIGCEK